MATANAARHERIAAAIKDALLQEYPHMSGSWAEGVAASSAVTVVSNAGAVAVHDYRGKIRALHFTDLPRELRDHIYEYVVVSDQAIGIALTYAQASMLKASYDFAHPYALVQPGLSRTSRQMREETLGLFYKSNKFVASLNSRNKTDLLHKHKTVGPVRGESFEVLKKWLRCIGPINVNSIGELVLAREQMYRGSFSTRGDLESAEGVLLPTNISEDYLSHEQTKAWRKKLLSSKFKSL